MTPINNLINVKDLSLTFATQKGKINLVEHISFSIKKGEILGVVGESGCGKSITSLTLMNLLPENGRVSSGSIEMEGRELLNCSENEWCDIRGNEIAMIFQDPLSALNPVMSIGKQMMEPIMRHQNVDKKEAELRALEMLRAVGISAPERRMKEFPHQLSGGMRQRVMIAMALSCKPQLLIADEPTTALDVTIQAQILELMKQLRDASGTAIMLVTHDMGVVAETVDRVIVMYAGQIVEEAPVEKLFKTPQHPYTQGLLRSIPRLDRDEKVLPTIKGTVPDLSAKMLGCPFYERCPHARTVCRQQEPITYQTDDDVFVKCWRYEKGGEYSGE